ncbi:G-alpha-domain-containing protein [Amylocystis lapponica]|nr:G-alpha-domain-containing protein [Amylocystis lapponica]
MGRSLDDDPFAQYLAPPSDETTEQKEQRLSAEAEARRISDKIDEQLKEERAALKNSKKKPVKVLLLGQSESGKSTTLKNFQLTYSPKAWTAERASWRTVIQLNLVRNVNTILDLLAEEMTGVSPFDAADSDVSDEEEQPVLPRSSETLRFTDKHALLKLRLAPLRRLQKDLEFAIGASSGEEGIYPPTPTAEMQALMYPQGRKGRQQEFFVRSLHSWQDGDSPDLSTRMLKHREASVRDATEIIAGCADDMKEIWEDATVQQMLQKRRVTLEAGPGFFLNDVERIAARSYEPSDDDVVRARLRTLGVQEYRIKFETASAGPTQGSEWLLYDVGGSRTQRYKWIPYFDDCDAIIFLAPINCFDERLAEDRRVNRLEDSYMLWKAVCGSKLLQKTQMILFLNKCDLLDMKLRSGVRVKDYVRSFGDRPNDVETASKYFAQHFKDILRRHSPENRPFRVHMTSVIDTKETAATLGIVQEIILRSHLLAADLA